MKKYQQRKAAARQEAIDWQEGLAGTSMSYGELAEAQGYFEKQARRYGLVREFRENAII
jgi:hypothetical protein